MAREKCPLCGRPVTHLLEHLVMIHRIRDANEYRNLVRQADEDDQRAARFAKFIAELREKRERGDITAEEFRRLAESWSERKK